MHQDGRLTPQSALCPSKIEIRYHDSRCMGCKPHVECVGKSIANVSVGSGFIAKVKVELDVPGLLGVLGARVNVGQASEHLGVIGGDGEGGLRPLGVEGGKSGGEKEHVTTRAMAVDQHLTGERTALDVEAPAVPHSGFVVLDYVGEIESAGGGGTMVMGDGDIDGLNCVAEFAEAERKVGVFVVSELDVVGPEAVAAGEGGWDHQAATLDVFGMVVVGGLAVEVRVEVAAGAGDAGDGEERVGGERRVEGIEPAWAGFHVVVKED